MAATSYWSPFQPYICSVIDSVAGPQLLMPCRSYSGAVSRTCGGRGESVAVGVAITSGVAVGGAGVALGNGVEGAGVGMGPTGSSQFRRYVLHTSYRQSIRLAIFGTRSTAYPKIMRATAPMSHVFFGMRAICRSLSAPDEQILIGHFPAARASGGPAVHVSRHASHEQPVSSEMG